MKNLYHRLLLVIAGATQKELATYVRYLKTENQALRSKLPKRVLVTEQERAKLVKFGSQLGGALDKLVTIVHPNTLRRWILGHLVGLLPCQCLAAGHKTSAGPLVDHWFGSAGVGGFVSSGFCTGRPDIQEEILLLPCVERGRDPVTERDLRPIVAATDWGEQRGMWPT